MPLSSDGTRAAQHALSISTRIGSTLHPNIKLYQGDSIGKFEGDVLTVETRNQMAGWWDATGAVHSDQVHVVEKFTFRDSQHYWLRSRGYGPCRIDTSDDGYGYLPAQLERALRVPRTSRWSFCRTQRL